MPCLFVAPWLSVLSSTPVPPGALAVLSLTMVMSLFAPGASPVASAASATVALSPKASVAAVLKSVSFDLIVVSFGTEVLGEALHGRLIGARAGAGTNGERVGSGGVPIADCECICPLGRVTAF